MTNTSLARRSLFLDPTGHVAAALAVLPGAGVAIAVKEQANGERAETRQRGVGHHDHRCIANPAHRYDDRDGTAHAATIHVRVEAPEVGANFFDARDVVAIRARRTIFAAGNGEAADEADVAHPF